MSFFAIPNVNTSDYTEVIKMLSPYIKTDWYTDNIWVVGISRILARRLVNEMPEWVEVIL